MKKQQPLFLIGIAGTCSAGKGLVSDYLCSYGFTHYSVTELMLVPELNRTANNSNRSDLHTIANDLRARFGGDYLAWSLHQTALMEGTNRAIIESIRCPAEADYILHHGILLTVDADPKLRYNRAKERGSFKDNVSFKEFIAQEEQEMNNTDPLMQNIFYCINTTPKPYRLQNNSTKEALYQQIDRILQEFV